MASESAAVRQAYGAGFTILADGIDVCSVSYTWKMGRSGDHPILQPVYQDLANYEQAVVEPGFVAIDAQLGRFKFSQGNRLAPDINARFIQRIEMGNLDPWCVEVRNGLVFTAQEEETRGLQVVDARDPASLRYAASVPMSGYPFFLLLGETHAYLIAGDLLGVADVTDPLRPLYVKSMPVHGSLKARLADRRIFFAGGDRGVIVYDVRDPDDPELEEVVSLAKPFDLDTADGRTFYLLEDGAQPSKEGSGEGSFLKILARDEGGGWRELGRLGGFGRFGPTGGNSLAGCHRIRVANGHVFFADTRGLHSVDVRDPARPRLAHTVEALKIQDEYYGLGLGALDLCVRDNLLFIAAGRSDPAIRANRDFPHFQQRKKEDWPERRFVGGVYVFDISQAGAPRLSACLDEAEMGMHTVTNVAVEGNILYACSRIMGLATWDISDLAHIRFLGRISLAGEVEYAHLVGDLLLAEGNGLYVCRAFPADKAEILGYCWTDTWLMGQMSFARPGSPYLWFQSLHGDGMRLLNISNPRRPYIEEYFVPPFTWAAWLGDHLYAAKAGHHSWEEQARQQKMPIAAAARRTGEIVNGLVIYDVRDPRNPNPVSQVSTEGPLSRLELRGSSVFALGTGDGGKKQVVHVFDVSNPLEPRALGKWVGDYSDQGLMGSWRMLLYQDRLFLPMSEGRGVRVLDISDLTKPRLKYVLSHHDRTFGVHSLMSANTFHVAGDRLFISDYWHGVHVFDVSALDRPVYLETLKSPDRTFSAWSYGTSVSGYGRYIYKTAFGGVDLYEVSAPPERPQGRISSWVRPVKAGAQ